MSWFTRMFGMIDPVEHARLVNEFVNKAREVDHQTYRLATEEAIRQLTSVKETLGSMSTPRPEYQAGLLAGIEAGLENLRVLHNFPKPDSVRVETP